MSQLVLFVDSTPYFRRERQYEYYALSSPHLFYCL